MMLARKNRVIKICKLVLILACVVYSPVELTRIIVWTAINPHIRWFTPMTTAIPEIIAIWILFIVSAILLAKILFKKESELNGN